MVGYRLSSQFILRMAGFPIERVLSLREPELVAALDAVIAARDPALEAAARARLGEVYGPAIERARRTLWDIAASQDFRRALLFFAPGLEARIVPAGAPLPRRNSDCRHHEHSLMLYLQRFCAKNDTIGFYGPSAWGRIEPGATNALSLVLADEKVAERALYIERWVCEALAERIDAEVPVSASPFDAVLAQIRAWPPSAERQEWLSRFTEIEARRAALELASDLDTARTALDALSDALESAGLPRAKKSRALYAARLPVNEDCRRGVKELVIGAPLVEQATTDLADWYELWRDLAGLYATRVGAVLRRIFHGIEERPVTLQRFFRACREAGIDFYKNFGTGLVPELYDEVQAAWQAELGPRMDAREIELDSADLAFIRRRFELERMRAFDLPAPDLQIMAPDAQAVRDGRFQLLVGEIHPDLALWENCFMLWCPDPEALGLEYRAHGHAPAILFGPTDELGVHVMVRAHEWAKDWTFVRPLHASDARNVDAGDVLVDDIDGDLVVRTQDGDVLGSLVHHWRMTSNTHRFELVGTGPHSPRLRVGRVIVQRESWRLEPDDVLRGAVAEVRPDALIALRRLRQQRGFPEEVFARPEIRLTYHKDAKPIFVDFENPLSLEVFAGWVRRYLRLRVTEALPSSKDLWLADREGRYSFELRCLAMPDPETLSASVR